MTPPLPDLDALLREQEWLQRLACRLLGDGADADDLAQETLTRALSYQQCHQNRHASGAETPGTGRPSTRGWLGTIARNLRLERRREAARRAEREKAAARAEAEGAQVDTEALDRTFLRRTLIDEVLRLPEPERSPLILHYFEGLSHGEIAIRLGIQSDASRKRVSRAMARLREAMDRRPGGSASLGVLLAPIGAIRESLPLSAAALGSASAAPLPAAAIMTLKAKLALLLVAVTVAAMVAVSTLLSRGANPNLDDVDTASPAELGADPGRRNNASNDAQSGPSGTTSADRRPAEPQQAAVPAAITHAIVGRVVDRHRMPIRGASTKLGWVYSNPNAVGLSAVTEDDGTFRIETVLGELGSSELPRVSVIARGKNGLAAAAVQVLPAPLEGRVAEVDMGTLVLMDSHRLTVAVHGPPASIRVFVTHSRLPWGTFQTDDSGQVTIADLPRGAVFVVASTETNEARALAFVPEDTLLELHPEATRSIDVQLVDAESGAPVPGARLNASEWRTVPTTLPSSPFVERRHEQKVATLRTDLRAITDHLGMARIDGLTPGVEFELQAEAEGYFGITGRADFTSETGALTAKMAPHSPRTVRWLILPGEIPVPEDGTVIECTHAPSDRDDGKPVPTARIENGELIAEGVVDYAHLIVRTPDQSLGFVYAMGDSTVGEAFSFVRPRQIRVTLTGPSGHPIEGVRVKALDQGGDQAGVSAPSGPDGVATVPGLLDDLLDLHASPPPGSAYPSGALGTVQIEGSDVEIAVTMNPTRVRRVRLRISANGSPTLPHQFSVSTGSPLHIAEEDPVRGELVVELMDAKLRQEIELSFVAKGFAPEALTVRFERQGEVPTYDIALRPTANLVVDVTPMEGERADVMAEKYDPASGEWASSYTGHLISFPNGPDGAYVFPWITPGKWRARELNTMKVSESIDVSEGATQAHTELDLSSSAWVTGTVEAPGPGDLGPVRILVDDGLGGWATGNGSAFYPRRGAPLKGSAFRVLVPGDREVTLIPWHPWLSPAASGGVARVTRGKGQVVLRLEQGHGVVIPAPQLNARRSGAVRIGRYPAGTGKMGWAKGALLAWHYGPVVAGKVRAALPEGTWSLCIDPGPPFAPVWVPSVRVNGEVELPPLHFGEGSSVVLAIKVPAGTTPPRLFVNVTSLTEPSFRRSINSDGEFNPRIPGLPAGRYRVEYSLVMGKGLERTVDVTVDGEHATEIPVDLR